MVGVAALCGRRCRSLFCLLSHHSEVGGQCGVCAVHRSVFCRLRCRWHLPAYRRDSLRKVGLGKLTHFDMRTDIQVAISKDLEMFYKVIIERIVGNGFKLVGPMETTYLKSLKEVERKLRTYQVTPDEFYPLVLELLSGIIVVERSNSKLAQVA